MINPWNNINLSDYENHMQLENVFQLQELNESMKSQFKIGKASSILILGVAGGNGLEHVAANQVNKLFLLDINEQYLTACRKRYPHLSEITTYLCEDITDKNATLPHADLVIANLFIEYVGYQCFLDSITKIAPRFVSCIIQLNEGEKFVSESPYIHAFDELEQVHHEINEVGLRAAMKSIGYQIFYKAQKGLPNHKKLVQLDLEKIDSSL